MAGRPPDRSAGTEETVRRLSARDKRRTRHACERHACAVSPSGAADRSQSAPQGEAAVLKQLSATELRAQAKLIAPLDKQPQALVLPSRKSAQSVRSKQGASFSAQNGANCCGNWLIQGRPYGALYRQSPAAR